MRRIPIPLVGGQYIGRSTNIDAQECINFYPVLDKSGGKPYALYPVPGLKEWLDIGVGETRGFHKLGNYLYTLIGDTVYKITEAGGYTALSTTLSNDIGPVQIVDNGTQILIGDLTDGTGWVIESDTVTQITDEDFPTISSLTYQNGYAVVSESGTQNFYISKLDTASLAAYSASDFTRWDALEYGTAEGLPDNLQAILSDHEELWAFGNNSIEYFYNSGNADFPFEKTQHPYQEIGLGGTPACIQKLDNSLFWLDKWHNVRVASGYTPVIITTPEISYNFEQFDVSDATAFSYRHEGHNFYVLNFPTGDKTYVFDTQTKQWHLRSSNGRWRANCYVYFAGKHLVGDFQDGRIYELDHETYTDAGETFPAVRTTRYTESQGRKIIFHRLELDMQAGVGDLTTDDPQIMLKWSDDGGHTWSNEHWESMGKIGEYSHRVIWRRLGASRDRIFKFRITDPVNRVLISLNADVTLGV